MSASTLTTSLTGNNNDLDFTAAADGVEFNAISIQYIDPGAASQTLAVTFNGKQIKVYLATDSGSAITTTAAQVNAAVCGTKATNLLTSTNTAPADGSSVTIGGQTYVWKTSLTASTTKNQVLINSTADAALLNLSRAINGLGTPGTDYGSLTLPNGLVSASTSVTSHTILISARNVGAQYNSIPTTQAGTTHVTFPEVTLGGASATSIGADGIDTGLDPVSGVSNNNPRRTQYLLGAANHSGNDGTGVVTALTEAFLSGSTLEPPTGYADVATAKASGWVFLGDITTGKVTMPAPQNAHNSQVDQWQAFHVSKEVRASCQISDSSAHLLIATKLYAAQCARKGTPILIKPYLDPASYQV